MTEGSQESWEGDFKRCVEFHGHACPGLAMGYRAAKAAMEMLGENRSKDEEIVAIAETDACGCDAVQVITGCTFGKGNFFYKDYGKTAFSFLSRRSGAGVRFIARPDALSLTAEHRALFDKVWNNSATEKDLKSFWDVQRERTITVLNQSLGDLYLLEEVVSPLPQRARILDSKICGCCGETVMVSRLTETEEGFLCRSCQERDEKSGQIG